jgi:iron complex transport system substrate-binding protein
VATILQTALAVLLCAVVPCRSETAAPARVVSLAPSLTQTVRHLGAGGRLVAVTPFCEAPAAVTRVAGGIQPEAEVVLALEPDLVLCTSMTPHSTRRQLSNLGLRVEVIDTPSLPSIRSAVARVASVLGVAAPAGDTKSAAPDGPATALLFGAETGYSAGRGSHAHGILEDAGLRNIAADAGGPWPQLGEEFLLAADPELIVVADYGPADRGEVLRLLRSHPVRRHLAAVRDGRVVVFPAAALTVPGPDALRAGSALRAEVEKR